MALPIIASVVAPSAALAQSAGLAIFSSCSSPGQCQSGNCTIGSMLCCVAGSDPLADGSGVCAAPGTCASFTTFCCNGMLTDAGAVPPCNGGTTSCVCA